MKKILISILKLYQRTLSPDHGWFSRGEQRVCRFHPTCSQYMIEAIEKHGSLKGVIMGIWRILRCNPFNKGGLDPVEPVSLKGYIKKRRNPEPSRGIGTSR